MTGSDTSIPLPLGVAGLLRSHRRIIAAGLLLMVVNRAGGLLILLSTRYLVDDAVIGQQRQLLTPLSGLILIGSLIQSLTTFSMTRLFGTAEQTLIASLRRMLHGHVVHLPVSIFDATSTASLATRIMNDVEGAQYFIGVGMITVVGGVFWAVVAFAVMFHISPPLAAGASLFLLVFLLGWAVPFLLLRRRLRERAEVRTAVTARLFDSLAGVRVVKAYGAEQLEASTIGAGINRLRDIALKIEATRSLIQLVTGVLVSVVAAACAVISASEVAAGRLSVGGLFACMLLLGFVISPSFEVVAVSTHLSEALAGLARTQDLLSNRREDLESTRRATLSLPLRELVIDSVSFAYDGQHDVLRDISFSARPGAMTAIVGASGAGKSTLIGLLAAFHSPRTGRIIMNGRDVLEYPLVAYRAQIAVVLQDSFLFNGSLWDNVVIGRPYASRADVLDACRATAVDQVADDLQGYDALVGDRGARLSRGQRQRVALARAVLSNRPILLLDEATASLDAESDAQMQAALARMSRERTTFVVAHRLTTIERADQILVLDRGTIVERGDHRSLLAAGGRYAALHRLSSGFLPPCEQSP